MPTRKPQTIALNIEGATEKKYVVYPSAEGFIKNRLKRALGTGTIKSESDSIICETALIAAGLQEAQSGRAKVVTVRDVKRGYDKYVRSLHLACPIHRCMRSSILDREEELKGELPLFHILLTNRMAGE